MMRRKISSRKSDQKIGDKYHCQYCGGIRAILLQRRDTFLSNSPNFALWIKRSSDQLLWFRLYFGRWLWKRDWAYRNSENCRQWFYQFHS